MEPSRSAPGPAAHRGPRKARVLLAGLALLAEWALLGIGGGLATAARGETQWSFLKPQRAKERLSITVCGNDWTYYRLDRNAALEFSAEGPRRVKLITRQLGSGVGPLRTGYTIRVTRGADEKEIFRKQIFSKEEEDIVCQTTGDPVGEGEESILHVPRGKWDFKLYLHEGNTDIAVRLLEEEQVRRDLLVLCVPDEFERVLVLQQPSGNEYPHYRFTRQQPLIFSLQGPARISVRTRLDFAPGGPAIAPYGIEVIGRVQREGVLHEELRETVHYWAQRLERVAYKDEVGLRPGESMELDLAVPAGAWTIELRPVDADVPGIAARVLVPKRALRSELSGESE